MHEYPQDREPEHELRDDSTPDHDWEYGDMPGVTANDPQDPDRRDVDDNLPPPDDTNPETDLSEPNRGQLLQQVANYGAVAPRIVMEALEERRTIAKGGIEAMALLADRGIPLDEADDLLRKRPDHELQEEVAHTERRHAELQYREALQATGLVLHSDPQGVEVRMADPARFVSALQEAEQPEDAMADENLAGQTQAIIDNALDRAAKTIVMQYPDEARTICGGTPPMGEAFIEADVRLVPSDEDIMLADTLPHHARAIADAFENISGQGQGQEGTARGALGLALAYESNQMIEWGLGRHISILGDGETVVGLERLTSEREWDAVCAYLSHLQRTAPHTSFTAYVRTQVLDDIDYALREIPLQQEAEDAAMLDFAIKFGPPEEDDTYGVDAEEPLDGDSTLPTLRSARDRIRTIFGL